MYRKREIRQGIYAYVRNQEGGAPKRRVTVTKVMALKVIIEGEVTTVLTLGRILLGLLAALHDTGLLVVGNTLLKEVGLATKGDVLHEVKGVGSIVDLVVAQGDEKTIGDELNVLLHEVAVHAQKSARQSFGEELLLNHNGISDDCLNHLFASTSLEMRVKETGKVGVKTLITRDELVGKGQTRHEATLLEPEDGSEGAAKEDTLDSSESDEALGKGGLLVGDPSERPLGLLLDARN